MYRDAMRQAPAGVVMPDSEVFAGVLIRHGCSSLRYKPPMIAQHFSDAVSVHLCQALCISKFCVDFN